MEVAIDKNYIRVVDDFLEKEFCDHLIEKFEQCSEKQYTRNDFARLDELPLWTQNHVASMNAEQIEQQTTINIHDFSKDVDYINQKLIEQTRLYSNDWDEQDQWPNQMSIEGFRIKCYRAERGDEFPPHSDAVHARVSKRFLGCLIYLNNSDAGTRFIKEDLTIDAVQGRLVMFPPYWLHPHQGLKPNHQDKYITSTYLNLPE